jgi:hypothetical protein
MSRRRGERSSDRDQFQPKRHSQPVFLRFIEASYFHSSASSYLNLDFKNPHKVTPCRVDLKGDYANTSYSPNIYTGASLTTLPFHQFNCKVNCYCSSRFSRRSRIDNDSRYTRTLSLRGKLVRLLSQRSHRSLSVLTCKILLQENIKYDISSSNARRIRRMASDN